MIEARVDRLELALERLTEAQVRTEEALSRLAATVQDQGRQIADQGQQIARLAAAVEDQGRQIADQGQQIARLAAAVEDQGRQIGRLTTRTGGLHGIVLERRYFERAPAYFLAIMRRIHPMTSEEVATLADDALDAAVITEAERQDLLLADVVVRGRQRADDQQAYLVVEVSAVVDEHDVWRALRRAEIMARASKLPSIAVVAGEQITSEADELGANRGVWRVLDGRVAEPGVKL